MTVQPLFGQVQPELPHMVDFVVVAYENMMGKVGHFESFVSIVQLRVHCGYDNSKPV